MNCDWEKMKKRNQNLRVSKGCAIYICDNYQFSMNNVVKLYWDALNWYLSRLISNAVVNYHV